MHFVSGWIIIPLRVISIQNSIKPFQSKTDSTSAYETEHKHVYAIKNSKHDDDNEINDYAAIA